MWHYTHSDIIGSNTVRPDISTAVPDSKKCEVSKSQEFYGNHECTTLKS